MIRLLGARVGVADRADRLADELEAAIADARRRAMQRSRRPLVYFEEWDEPMISGIAWVSELIEVAGGIDIFADRSAGKSAKDRMVTAEEIIAREPDVIIGSWCGKKFRPEKVTMRPGFERIPAVRNDALYEVKSPIILQPGPASPTGYAFAHIPIGTTAKHRVDVDKGEGSSDVMTVTPAAIGAGTEIGRAIP
jgi:iron complex transport system substrate-binding protein